MCLPIYIYIYNYTLYKNTMYFCSCGLHTCRGYLTVLGQEDRGVTDLMEGPRVVYIATHVCMGTVRTDICID